MISTTFSEPQTVAESESKLLRLLKLMADATRLRILMLLRDGEQNVTQFCCLLKQSQPAISHHLRQLRNGGLIKLRRDGKHNFYSLKSDVELPKLVSQLFTSAESTPA